VRRRSQKQARRRERLPGDALIVAMEPTSHLWNPLARAAEAAGDPD